jgi:hypothetical protein
MNYLLLIYADETELASARQADANAMHAAYRAFTEGIAASGVLRAGDALEGVATATTVRVRGGETVVTDGPFAETKEQLGGYYLVECDDLDAAIEIAARIPGAVFGSIEIRPIMSLPS